MVCVSFCVEGKSSPAVVAGGEGAAALGALCLCALLAGGGTLVMAASAGLGLGLGQELGQLLFSSAQAGEYICMFSLLVLMLYPDAITDGMLKGLGQQLHSVRYNTLPSLLDVGMLAVLLPTHGMGGFLAAFTVSHGVNFFLSLSRLIRGTGYQPRFHATVKAALAV